LISKPTDTSLTIGDFHMRNTPS